MVAIEPRSRRIAYMKDLRAMGAFTALIFIKRIKAIYRPRIKALTSRAQLLQNSVQVNLNMKYTT